ncbi:electron transfer flavoprotein subunit beta/FixA family protein [Chloroflexota bacterium]
MEVLVYIKAVPGYVTSPEVPATGDGIGGKTGPLLMNESDEYALGTALALKKDAGGEVSVLSAGPISCQEVIYKGLAKGADRGVRVDVGFADSLSIARALVAASRHLEYDLILTGVESSDNMSAVVGQSAAEMLGLPFVYSATDIKPGSGSDCVTVTRELGGGVSQVVEVKLPALVCVQSGTTPLGFIPVRKLLQARSKSVTCLDMAVLDMGEEFKSPGAARIVEVFYPQKGAWAEIITGEPAAVASVLMKRIREAL